MNMNPMRLLIALCACVLTSLTFSACGGTKHAPRRASHPSVRIFQRVNHRVLAATNGVRPSQKARFLRAAAQLGSPTGTFGSAAAPTVGEVLTTTNGTWPNAPTSFSYQWQQCNSTGGACTFIVGATSASYTIQAADVRHTLVVQVTASNASGHGTSLSQLSGVVTASTKSPALFGLVDYFNGPTITPAQAAPYKIVLMQYAPGISTQVDAIHSQDPGIKLYMYSDPTVATTSASSTDGWTTCTTSAQDSAGGNSWYLYDGANRIGDKANIGNPAFESACTSHAIANAQAQHFDGIFWDEINAVSRYAISDPCVEAYQGTSCWDDATWQSNMYAMVQAIGSASASAGLLSITNIAGANNASAPPSLWAQWASQTTGAMEESYVGSYVGTNVPYSQWQGELQNVVWSEAHSKIFYGIHYDPNQNQESLDTYGLASMLLAAGAYSYYDSDKNLGTPSYTFWAEYTSAQNLGPASGPYTTVTSGGATVYERRFARGIVVVNPTTSASGSVALGGTYTGSGNEPTNVSSVTLSAQSGLILNN